MIIISNKTLLLLRMQLAMSSRLTNLVTQIETLVNNTDLGEIITRIQ